MGAFFENSNMVTEEDEATAKEQGADPREVQALRVESEAQAAERSEQLPEKIKEIRSAPERQMFDAEKQYTGIFKRGTFQDSLAGEDPELVQQVDSLAAGIYSDMRLSNPEAQQVHDVFTTEVSDEIAADWRSESEAYIKTLGAEGPAKLAAAQALARRDPRVLKMLEGPRGDNPTLVRLLVEKAAAEKRDGRL